MFNTLYFKTHNDNYTLACIPKCASSYYAWSILIKKYPSALKLLNANDDVIKCFGGKDALSLVQYYTKDEIGNRQVIIPFRDPLDRFTSLFLYLIDISKNNITGLPIDDEIIEYVIKTNGNHINFFDFLIDNFERIGMLVPQINFIHGNYTIRKYNDCRINCSIVDSHYLQTKINKGNKCELQLNNLHYDKIKKIYTEDFKYNEYCQQS